MLAWLKWVLLAAIFAGLAFTFIAAALGMEAALHPFPRRRASDTAALAFSTAHAVDGSARQITITAGDGVQLKAWYLTPAGWNGDTVIACHGVADSGFGVMGAALLFLRNHYSVLVPDSRGHGESGGFVTYAVREADDIVRWQAWLGSQHPAAVYGFGESLGGAIILQSLAAGAHFTAIVVESPYAYFAQVARERVVKYGRVPPWLAMLLIDEGMLYVRIRHGVDLSAAKPAEAVRASTTPILLIHGLDDQETYPIHSREILRNAVDARLWLVPHAKHTGAYGAAPREFESRVLRALAR